MKTIILISILIITVFSYKNPDFSKINLNRGYKHLEKEPQEGYVEREYNQDSISNLPESFDWGNVDGKNFLTIVQNQKLPQYCGSSYAFAVTQALSDRIKIRRNAAWPDINLSQQVLLSCSYHDQGCMGGNVLTAYEYIFKNGISDQTCSIYQAKGYTQGLSCTHELICGDCTTKDGCTPVEQYDTYKIFQYGKVSSEELMMLEIQKNGPITCAMANTPELEQYTGGIFKDETSKIEFDMYVTVVGWGIENGKKYWVIKNSWGTQWGIGGYLKLVKGINNLGIESQCSFGDLEDTWTQKDTEIKNSSQLIIKESNTSKFLGKLYNEMYQSEETHSENPPNLIISPLPSNYLKPSDIPNNWDWRNTNGKNYMSWTVNQHIPRYCGSCWAQSASSTIADRVNILRNNSFPQAAVSPQAVVNCRWGGTCHGGNALEVFQNAHLHGIPEMTCQNYIANDPHNFDCSPLQQCESCLPTKFGVDTCYPEKRFYRYRTAEYAQIPAGDVHYMRAEIMARGPISCSIYSTPKFHAYRSGIFREKDTTEPTNHVIQILGWGEELGEEYWIGRNSWGTYWGEYGYFKLTTNKDENMNLYSNCRWGLPTLDEEMENQHSIHKKRRITLRNY